MSDLTIGGRPAASSPAGSPSPRGPRSSFAEALEGAARSITEGQDRLEAALRAGRRGQVLGNEEILSLQAGVYRYTQELEIASKLIDKATSAVRTTLQSQQ